MKVKILKEHAAGKVGEIVDVNFPGGDEQEYIDNGFIEIIKTKKVKKKETYVKGVGLVEIEDNTKDKEETTQEKNFQGFHDYILEFIQEEEYVLLQEIDNSFKQYNLTKGEATKIVNSEKKKIKETQREEKELSLRSTSMLKEELIECVDETWETCDDNLFIQVCKDDWRKAKYYFVLRLLKEHTYNVDGNDVCGIRTFKDNKEIIIYDKTNGIYVQSGDLYLAHLIESRLKETAENKQVNEIIESIKRKTYYNRNDLDKQPKNIKPVGNGLLNLETNELLEFTPKYIFLNKININYNKDAICDKFKKFLSQVLQTKKDIDIVQEWCGYCLLNDTKYSKALLLFGDGENGKCQKGDNKVLMSDGSWKEIRYIKTGEEVISPQKDGTSKITKVINIHSRFEEDVYDVREKTRDKKILYTCAGNHIIPIIRTYTKRTSPDDSTPRGRERRLFEYDAEHISKLDNSKSQICSFTTTAIEYNQPNAEINPYCLGAWLGDGHFRSLRVKVKNWNGMKRKGERFSHRGNHLRQNLGITSMDKEIVDEFYKNYPNDNIRKTTKPNNKASTYNLSVIGKLAKELTRLRLNGKNSGNKFIPKECLLSSIDYRKNLLAGLIDTDGFVQKGTGATYYVTKSKQLSEDIRNLVFSIGGYCKINNITKRCQNGFIGNYFELSIQLKDYDIPLRLKRKSYRFSDKKYSPRNVAIECIKTNPQQVYGIEIEGGSKWYVTDNWMVTHNSVLLNSIKTFLNRENVTSISLQYLESSPFAPARLFGKTANIFADLPKKALSQTSVFKMTVAGDEISGEKKGKDSFEFKPTAKMMFSCNEIPRTPDRTRGFFRRWIILKFLEHFPEGDPRRDENLFEKLSDINELEGILNFAVKGLKRLIVQKGFTQNMKMNEVQEFWTRSSDSIATFVGDVLINDYGSTERKTDVYLKYEEYCAKNEYPPEEINNFWKRMKDVISFSEHQIKDGEMRIRTVQGFKIKR